ncbi:MAG: shikimate dehydrogenase family protein [Bacillota bacterium]|jgi:shikimate dehydrogenase
MLIYGLVGYPLNYSLSPAIHQAAYSALGMEAAYLLWPTAPERLAGRVEALRRQADVVGWNVTVPHKSAIIPLLDDLAPSAQALGAVNTVVKSQGRLVGHNTDLSGFCRSLVQAGVAVAGRKALVLGAGGAARAVCHGLLALAGDKLYLINRTLDRALRLQRELQEAIAGRALGVAAGPACSDGGQPAVSVVDPQELVPLIPDIGLLVNCTSSQDPWATFGLAGDRIWNRGRGWAVDLAYGRMLAGFLDRAKAGGWQTLDGSGMLLWQAVHAVEIWSGVEAPVEAMQRALYRELVKGDGQA